MMAPATMEVPKTLLNAIIVTGRFLDVGIEELHEAALLPLRRRLEGLLVAQPRPLRLPETAAIEEEMRIWVAAIQGQLAPVRRDAFIAALRAPAEGDSGVDGTDDHWVLLDPLLLSVRQKEIDLTAEHSASAATRMCLRYGRARSYSYIREAVKELETGVALARQGSRLGIRPADCPRLVEQLAAALSSMPKGIASVFAAEVRGRVANARGDLPHSPKSSRRRHREEDQWLSKRQWGEPIERAFGTGVWFTEELQFRLEAHCAAEKVDDLRRAEVDRRFLMWEAQVEARSESSRAQSHDLGVTSTPVPPKGDVARSRDRVDEHPPEEATRRVLAESSQAVNDPGPDFSVMSPAMAAAVRADLERRARHDRERAEREENRREYQRQLLERAW